MIKSLLRFIVVFAAILLISFLIHASTQHYREIGFFEMNIVTSYLFNFILTAVFYFVLLYFRRKRPEQLGFIFLFSSMLKLLLFFAILKPLISNEDGTKTIEFIAFFVPYGISMISETYSIVTLINKEE
tara:strand:- start:259 stop:645 length:387 start_codon:yes stop_codon:yes gene_type:complete